MNGLTLLRVSLRAYGAEKLLILCVTVEVRIVDPKSSDGVAAEAQHRQKRAEESRLKAVMYSN